MPKPQDDELVKRQVEHLISRFEKRFPIFSTGDKSITLDTSEVMELIVRVILFREQELKGP